MTRAPLLLVGALALLAAGCPEDPEVPDTIDLYSVTVAPPGRTATLTSDKLLGHQLTITRGVALAFSCWDSCKGACVGPAFEVDDPTLAEVRPVFRASGGYPTWVVLAKASGATQLRVTDACAEQVYGLTVADP